LTATAAAAAATVAVTEAVAATTVTAVTAATVSDVTVTHLSCDPVTHAVVLELVGGRTVCMWDVETGNVL
jgi:hypothetical protein